MYRNARKGPLSQADWDRYTELFEKFGDNWNLQKYFIFCEW